MPPGVVRNTPTCVGKTRPVGLVWFSPEKHPHVRGEDARSEDARACSPETPPRAWGRHVHRFGGLAHKGNTPTCVGKTAFFRVLVPSRQKHPHVRGEDLVHFIQRYIPEETPPRAWGRLSMTPSMRKKLRNTPTCVGKTQMSIATYLNTGKHPHVRGEDHIADISRYQCLETPPRAWGRQA